MSYRDDREADQARIEALEGELATARKQVAELERRPEQALATTAQGPPSAVRWLGAPLLLERSREIDHAFPVDKLEDLLASIQRIAGRPGRTERFQTSLTWRAPFRPTVSVVVRDGKTMVTVSDRLHTLAWNVFVLATWPGLTGVWVHLSPVGLLLPVGYLAARVLFRRFARQHAQLLERMFDTVVAEIEAAG
jgi:hypothetical protein